MNYKFLCKDCHTPVSIRNSNIYMRCMCDEDVRIIKMCPSDNIKEFIHDNLYLLPTEGTKLCHDGNLLEKPTNL